MDIPSGGTGSFREAWEVPGPTGRVLLGCTEGHLLPAVARTADALGLEVHAAPSLLDVVDRSGGRRVERLLQSLARELTAAETVAIRVATDPPADPGALVPCLLTAPTLAVELARRGITVEIGVLAEADLWSVYQPVVALADRTVVAHEALLRGEVDGREIGGGDLFFVAESAGWLARLDRIGRRAALLGAAPWLGTHDLYVNSDPAAVVRPQVCLADVEQVVHDSGLDPARLVVEVVESTVAADRGHLTSVLEHYRSLGWRVALVDVGAGWSSLSRLAAVRPDVVKLAKELVHELPADGARALVATVVEAAHRLGATVVAEGVETEEQAEQVAALGADLGQGWLFGRPVRPPRPAEQDDHVGGRWQPVPRPVSRPGRPGRPSGRSAARPVSSRAGAAPSR